MSQIKGIDLVYSTLKLLRLIHDNPALNGANILLPGGKIGREQVRLGESTLKQLCRALDECRHLVDLVHVYWGEDQGLVSLKNNRVLFNCHGDIDGQSSNDALAIDINDNDFAIMLPIGREDYPSEDAYEEALVNVANWDNVCQLLNDVRFDLLERVQQG